MLTGGEYLDAYKYLYTYICVCTHLGLPLDCSFIRIEDSIVSWAKDMSVLAVESSDNHDDRVDRIYKTMGYESNLCPS